MIDLLKIKSLSPVSNVPSIGSGETPNDTPKQNPLSNGVPVSNDYDEMGVNHGWFFYSI